MNIKSTGVFGDDRSADGLLRGVPSESIGQRDRATAFWHFIHDWEDDDLVETAITSGTATILDESINGALRLASPTVNQGIGSAQMVGAGGAGAWITPATARTATGETGDAREIVMEVGVTINDIGQCDWFIGLGEVDTTFMAATGALAANGADNHVGFHHVVADAEDPVYSYCGVAVANVDNTAFSAGSEGSFTMTDDTYTQLGLKITGTSTVEFWIDGILRHRQTIANALAEQMTPTFCLIGGAAASTMDIDYLLVSQTR